MSKLIKLELKKFNIRNNIIGAFIATIIILGLLCLIFFVERTEGNVVFENYEFMFSLLRSLINVTYLVFSAVLISKFIIEEYKNKTIFSLFMYPLNRKKIIVSKLIIITLFTFCFTLISQIIVFAGFYYIQVLTHTTLGVLHSEMLFNQMILFITSAFSNAMIGLIPLYFGMKKNSIATTILSSVIIASILHSNSNRFSLASITIIPILFSLVGLTVVYYSIKDINKKDLLV